MYISEIVEINNYRNLTGKTITFNDTLNFLIGENNIGKTNILELINICLAIGKFAETDFMDITLPIKIKFKVKYSNEEIGYFEDNFDVDDSNSITLVAVQDSVDEKDKLLSRYAKSNQNWYGNHTDYEYIVLLCTKDAIKGSRL